MPLDTPAVVVDLDRMDARIAAMASLMRERGIALRPHAKTHKSIEFARRQIDAGRGRPDGRHDRRGGGLRGRRLRGPVHRLPADRRRARRRIGCGGWRRAASLSVGADSTAGVEALAAAPMKRCDHVSCRVLIEIDSRRRADRRPPRAWRDRSLDTPRDLRVRGGRRVHPRGPRLRGDGTAPDGRPTTRSAGLDRGRRVAPRRRHRTDRS